MGILAGCAGAGRDSASDAGVKAEAAVVGFMPGTVQGNVEIFRDETDGTRIIGEFEGLLPNQSYALKIHEQGACTTPDSPGGILDPGGANRTGPLGLSPTERRAGSLPNIESDENGVGRINYTTPLLGTNIGPYSVIGRSIVLHSAPDDFETQPMGAIGEPIACGVIRPAPERS